MSQILVATHFQRTRHTPRGGQTGREALENVRLWAFTAAIIRFSYWSRRVGIYSGGQLDFVSRNATGTKWRVGDDLSLREKERNDDGMGMC